MNAENETTIKKKRRDSSANSSILEMNEGTESDSTIQKNDSTEKSFYDLPPEVLETIFQNVSSSDLLPCRRINRKFNEIVSRVMRQRADVTLYFSFKDVGEFTRKFLKRHCQELLINICRTYSVFGSKSLTDLVECLKKSKHFPITSFRFDDLDKFGNKDMRSFLSLWGRNILALNITLKDPLNNVGILRDLLVEKVPNLKKLEIDINWEEFKSSIQLFVDANEFQLPNLQVLCVNSEYRQFRGIIANILKAARNLKEFWICEDKDYHECVEDSITTDNLAMLQSFDKLHCLQNLQINLSEDLIAFCLKSPKIIDLKPQSLAISLQLSIWTNKQLKSKATSILNQLFHSSKDVIQTLRMNPLGSLGVNIPEFKHLVKLELFEFTDRESTNMEMFPVLFEMADSFPNLKDLAVHIHSGDALFFPTSQPLKPMPSVEVLRIVGDVSECTDKLMKATPNVTKLLIKNSSFLLLYGVPISINFESIKNYLPKLQSFGWLITRFTHHDLLDSLDAAITGFPMAFCRKHSEKLRNKESLSVDELALYQLQPRNSSILDLKELKQFDVTFSFYEDGCDFEDSDECDSQCKGLVEENEAGFDSNHMLYKTGFTKVSKFLAFDLMPNLKIRMHRHLH